MRASIASLVRMQIISNALVSARRERDPLLWPMFVYRNSASSSNEGGPIPGALNERKVSVLKWRSQSCQVLMRRSCIPQWSLEMDVTVE